jgi:small subunit ribosomal protein S6
MALYESVFIARQDVSSNQVDEFTQAFTKVIEDNDGKVTKTENWGLRNLAYKIKKNRKGHYVLFNVDAPAKAIEELERAMRFNEDVIRYLTVKVEELEDGPSAMMERRGRDDRGGRGRDDRGGRGRDDRGGRGRDDRGGRGRDDRGGSRGAHAESNEDTKAES